MVIPSIRVCVVFWKLWIDLSMSFVWYVSSTSGFYDCSADMETLHVIWAFYSFFLIINHVQENVFGVDLLLDDFQYRADLYDYGYRSSWDMSHHCPSDTGGIPPLPPTGKKVLYVILMS